MTGSAKRSGAGRLGGHCFCAALLLLLTACGSSQPPGGADAASGGNPGLNAAAPQFGLPQDLAGNLRSADFSLTAGLRLGADFEPSLPSSNVSADGGSLLFRPSNMIGTPRFSYAIYALSLPGADFPATLQLSWAEDKAPQKLWLALSDWPASSWKIVPLEDPAQLSPGSLEACTDANDRLLLALLMYGGPEAQLESLQFAQSAAPDAILYADYYELDPNLDTHLFAGYSTDDNGIAGYAWDLDSDGIFGEDGAEAAAKDSITATTSFSELGHYRPAVRVYDINGSYADAEVDVTVVDSGGGGGGGGQEINAVLSVFPCLAFQGSETDVTLEAVNQGADLNGLNIEWDLDNDGVFGEPGAETDCAGQSVLDFVVTPDSAADVTYAVRLSAVSGAVSIASGVLVVNGWSILRLPAGGVVHDLDIADMNGHAALVYSLEGSGEVYFAQTADPASETAASWNQTKLGSYPAAPQLALGKADGWPALALGVPAGADPARLDYRRASDPYGDSVSSWNGAAAVNLTLAEGNAVEAGQAMAIGVVDGRPALAFQQQNPASTPYSTVYFSHSTSADGAGLADWSAPVAVHTKADPDSEAGGFGYELQLREVGGRPALAYLSEDGEGDRQVWYNIAANADGTAAGDWSNPLWISHEFDAPEDHPRCRLGGLSLIAGSVALSYSDSATQQFRYRRSSTATGETASDWANGENFLLPVEGEGQFFSMCVPMAIYLRETPAGPQLWRATKGSMDGSSPDWIFDVSAYGPITRPEDNTACAGLCSAPVAGRIRAACLSSDRQEILYIFWQ